MNAQNLREVLDRRAADIMNHTPCDGMTLRDWFAGQEQLSDCNDIDMGTFEALAGKRPDGNLTTNTIAWLEWEAAWRARIRYIRADAMLKAREAKP